jgi:hypothetical protein
MDYGRIISESFRIAWRYKSLWVFGLFASGGSGFNLDFNNLPLPKTEFDSFGFGESFRFPFDMDLNMLMPIILLIGFMMLGYLIMHLISVPAIIDGVNKIKRGGHYRFGSSFSAGVDFFLRFLGLLLIGFFTMIVVIAVMVAGGFIAYALGDVVLLVLAILGMIPIFMAFLFVFTNMIALTQRAVVVRNIGIADALEESFWLLRRNLVKNLLIFLIEIGFSIALGIAAFIIWFFIGAPIALLVLATGAGIIPAIILAVIIGLPVSLVVGGFSGTVLANIYTLFYFELVEPGGRPKKNVDPAVAPA